MCVVCVCVCVGVRARFKREMGVWEADEEGRVQTAERHNNMVTEADTRVTKLKVSGCSSLPGLQP